MLDTKVILHLVSNYLQACSKEMIWEGQIAKVTLAIRDRAVA